MRERPNPTPVLFPDFASLHPGYSTEQGTDSLLSFPRKREPSIPEADIAKSQRQPKRQRLLGPRFRGDDSGEVCRLLFTMKKYANSENNA
jgi:hypothetical protein